MAAVSAAVAVIPARPDAGRNPAIERAHTTRRAATHNRFQLRSISEVKGVVDDARTCAVRSFHPEPCPVANATGLAQGRLSLENAPCTGQATLSSRRLVAVDLAETAVSQRGAQVPCGRFRNRWQATDPFTHRAGCLLVLPDDPFKAVLDMERRKVGKQFSHKGSKDAKEGRSRKRLRISPFCLLPSPLGDELEVQPAHQFSPPDRLPSRRHR